MRSGPQFVLDGAPIAAAGAVDLDPEQQAVVDHRHGPLLVLAGPGTGKTTTIVEAMAARLEDATDPIGPDAVLALTFGKRAAAELRDRVVARLGGGVLPTVATFHSFAYALLRQAGTPEEYREPPRLLSGAEEDVRIRELLVGAVADGAIRWPDELAGAIGTLGLANEVRAVLARAKELGLEPRELARIGARSDRPAWQALGVLAEQEADIMVLENVLDYVELLHRAVLWAGSSDGRARLADRFRAIYVDEYQDTDRLQVALLRALVGPRTSIVAVGDPDQSIYGFRGADVGGLLRFPQEFPAADGSPAPIVVLRHTRRFGPQLRAAATGVLGRRGWPGLDPALATAHRTPTCTGASAVHVELFDSATARAAHVAQEIRLAHLRDGVAWREMAVLVRTSLSIPPMQQALMQAGVPVAVAADEIPLRAEPAVAVLLAALNAAARPERMSPTVAADLLVGPLGGIDPSHLRRIGRDLRAEARRDDPSIAPDTSDALLRDVLIGRRDLPASVPDDLGRPLRRLQRLLAHVHAQITGGATPAQALWTLWSGEDGRAHGWPARLRAAALAGSRSAHHELDAVMALFDTAERAESMRRGVLGVTDFVAILLDQQIPAEPVAERSISADAVRVLTAHRAKGLEWDRVWIVDAEEGVWPDLRTRGSVLEPDRLTAEGLGDPIRPAQLLAEERRLFYVALTRARFVATVAALADDGDDGPQPSRFLADLGVEANRVLGRPAFAASAHGLVAQLRSVLQDERASASLRDAAAAQLAVLAAAVGEDGSALVPAAHPDAWWGRHAMTHREEPIRPSDAPVSMSGSKLEGLLNCPLQWFLERDVHAEVQRGTATKFGSVVHAVAEYVAKGEVPAVLDAADAVVDRVWRDMRFEADWQSNAERARAREAVARFLAYHLRADRTLESTEAYVSTEVDVPTPEGDLARMRLSGFLDRIERDADGRIVPIDLKNMRRAVPEADVPTHAQLGIYQLIMRELGDDVGGAALVQLLVPEGRGSNDPKVQVQDPLPADSPTWIERELGQAASVLRREDFVARKGRACTYCAYKRVCPTQPEGEQVTG